MQQRNFLIFITLSFLLIFASTFIQNWLSPPRPPQAPTKKLPADRYLASDLAARTQSTLAATPGMPGIGAAVQLATDARIAEWSVSGRNQTALVRKGEAKPEPPRPPPPAVAQQAGAPRQEIEIGGNGYNLTVLLTSHGAGVESLILNQFKAADEYGRPTGQPLFLISK